MKILHLAAHLGGGAGKAITGIVNKEDIVILLEQPEKDYYVNIAAQKVSQVLVAPPASKIEEIMQETDILLIHWWGHPLMAGFLADMPKVPCRLAIWNHINGCVYPYLSYSFLNEFDEVLFTTKYSYSNPNWTSIQRIKLEEKSSVVYGMGEFHPEQMIPKQDYKQNRHFTVGYIGTLNYAKLNPQFIRYCEAAATEIPDVRFCLVGDLSDEVRADIEKSAISQRFEIINYVQDVEKWYKSFDVLGYLLNSYNFATTENVLLEAMAYGIPIVVLNNQVEKHIVHDEVNGYVVDTPQKYAEILEKLYQNQYTRESIGIKAREYVCQTYNCVENKSRFMQNMRRCLQKEKTIHDFKTILGNTPYDHFRCFLRNTEQTQLEQLLVSGTKNGYKLQNVFMQKSKGSVAHYCKYYPEDEKLKKINQCLED